MPTEDDKEYAIARRLRQRQEEEKTEKVRLEWCDRHCRNYVADEGCGYCQREEDGDDA